MTTFEFYLDHCCEDVGAYYHFLIKFFEARPNIVTFKYLNVSDHGVGGTVGVQSLSGMCHGVVLNDSMFMLILCTRSWY